MPRPARSALLALLVLALGTGVLGVAGAPAAEAQAVPTGVRAATADGVPVVLVGVTGLRWDDVTALTTPALWGLSRTGAVGLVAARSVNGRACPADGWLAVSAGDRAADVQADDRTCRTLRDPGEDGVVPGWSDYVAAVDTQPYGAQLGLLGDAVADAGTPATGIGPGAAIALADADGLPVGTHVDQPATSPALTAAVREALTTSQLVVVDAGNVRDPGFATRSRPSTGPPPTASPDEELPPGLAEDPEDDLTGSEAIVEPTRTQQAQRVDANVAAVLSGARWTGATILVVSLADSGRQGLQLAVATGPAPEGGSYDRCLLTSGSTRQAGLIQTIDVTPTLLDGLGLEDAAPGLPGATIVPTPGPGTATDRVAGLIGTAQEALQVTRVSGTFSTRLVLAQAVLFIAAAIALTRTGRSDRTPLRPALRVLRVAALALGAAPIATFLTGTIPWWTWSSPRTAFSVVFVGWVAVITGLALAGPWRRPVLGPAGVVAAVTVLVIVVDACTGSTLVIDSPMGAHRLLAARFYGLSNQAFALLTAAGVLLAVVIADALLRRGRRTLATLSVAGLGLLLVVVDGAPGLGSDFGGPPALILAFALLTLVVSGRKVNWRTLTLIVVIATLVVIGFAVLDWLRPPDARTHLGRFIQTVVDGGVWDVVGRKISVNLRVLTNWRYLVLAIGGVLLTALVVVGPHPRRGGLLGTGSALAGLRDEVPLLRPAVAATGLALAVGFLINDSGIVVPATGIAVAVPCLVAAAAQWRLANPDVTVAGEPPPAEGSAVGVEAEESVRPPAG